MQAHLTSLFLDRWEGENEINNKEEFFMSVFKRWKGINIILVSFKVSDVS
jgi:hypothetical protein